MKYSIYNGSSYNMRLIDVSKKGFSKQLGIPVFPDPKKTLSEIVLDYIVFK
jgi:hypothetical protein